MKNPLQFTILLGLAATGLALAASDDIPRSDAAAVRQAIQFERAKDSASQRQLGVDASQPAKSEGRASEANNSEADRWTADRLADPAATGGAAESVSQAVRFERSKDAAAARQMQLDSRQAGGSDTKK